MCWCEAPENWLISDVKPVNQGHVISECAWNSSDYSIVWKTTSVFNIFNCRIDLSKQMLKKIESCILIENILSHWSTKCIRIQGCLYLPALPLQQFVISWSGWSKIPIWTFSWLRPHSASSWISRRNLWTIGSLKKQERTFLVIKLSRVYIYPWNCVSKAG